MYQFNNVVGVVASLTSAIIVVADGRCTRHVEVDVARGAAVVPRAPRGAAAARGGTAAVIGDDQREVVPRVPRATHDLGQPRAARVHVEPARRAAVEEAARGAAPGTDVAYVSRDVAAGLDEHERVRVVRLGAERLRVGGARLVDAEVAAGSAAVGGTRQVLPAHVAEERRPGVVPLHELVPWVGEVANGVLLLGHLSLTLSISISRLCAACCFQQYQYPCLYSCQG